jgi:hypothetical protein
LTQFKAIRNRVNSVVGRARNNYYREKYDAANPRESWKLLGSLMGRSITSRGVSGEEFSIDDKVTTDPNDICRGFNEYFSNIGEKLAKEFDGDSHEFMKYLPCNRNLKFGFVPTTVTEVKTVVMLLKNSSPGHDGIPIKMLKDNIDTLAPIICHI